MATCDCSCSMSNYYVAGLTIPKDGPLQSPTIPSSYEPAVDAKSPDRPQYTGGLSSLDYRRDPTASTVSPHYKLEEPLGAGVEPRNIIILGISFAGLSCAHHFLDHTIVHLCTTTQASYRLIIIGPSTHLHWNIAAPRALVAPGLIKHEATFIAVEPGFHRHRGHQFTIIQALCIEMNPEERSVKVDCYNFEAMKRCAFIQPKRYSNMPIKNLADLTKVQTLKYHALIICTGNSAHSDLLSLHGSHLDTAESLSRFHTQLAQATSIVIGGGRCSGVEAAGQLASYLNHKHHFPILTKRKFWKHITLISGGSVLLPELSPNLQRRAEKRLLSLGVTIIPATRIVRVEQLFNSYQEGKRYKYSL